MKVENRTKMSSMQIPPNIEDFYMSHPATPHHRRPGYLPRYVRLDEPSLRSTLRTFESLLGNLSGNRGAIRSPIGGLFVVAKMFDQCMLFMSNDFSFRTKCIYCNTV